MQRYKYLLTLGMVSLAVTLAGCSSSDLEYNAKKIVDQVENIVDADNEYVLSVKNGYPEAIPEITYGQAFESFFSNPTWNYFKAETGEDVVEFTGGCIYQDANVTARLQFILHDDGETFETGALKLNDILQSEFVTSGMVYAAFENYAEEHDIWLDDDAEEQLEEDIDAEEFIGYGDPPDDEYGGTQEYYYGDEADDEYNEWQDWSYDDDYYEDYEEIGDPPEDEYIFPHSDTKKLTVKQVKKLSKADRRLAKNEIYARHGRRFLDQSLQEYFDEKSWYFGVIEPEDFDESVFNKVEKYNIRLLVKYE